MFKEKNQFLIYKMKEQKRFLMCWIMLLIIIKKKNIYDEYKEQLEYIYTRYLLCSSLLRMVKVNDKEIREKLIEMTWTNLNTKFQIGRKIIF